MSKAIYTGVGGIARKVPKLYVGVDGVARKVKKGYVGVDGVARLFYTGIVTDLPSGYTKLEYIENPGGASLYLPGPWHFSAGYNSTIEFEFQVISIGGVLISSENDDKYSKPWRIYCGTDDSNNQGSIAVSVKPSPSSAAKSQTLKMDSYSIYDRLSLLIEARSGRSLNATLNNSVSTYLNTMDSPSTYSPIRILGGEGRIRFYSFELTENGETVCYLVPCKNPSGDVGVYDVVWKRFYSSESDVAFAAGPAV